MLFISGYQTQNEHHHYESCKERRKEMRVLYSFKEVVLIGFYIP